MKNKIIDLGMHPFADTFIGEKQLPLSEPVYSLQCLLDKDTTKIDQLEEVELTSDVLYNVNHNLIRFKQFIK